MPAIYNKRNFLNRFLSMVLAAAILLAVPGMASAAGRTALSTRKLTLKTGQTAVLKLKNNRKTASWKVVSGKKHIKITVLSKNHIRIKGISSGNAVVRVNAGQNKYRCKITVKASNNPTSSASPTASASPSASTLPSASSSPTSSPPSPSPGNSSEPAPRADALTLTAGSHSVSIGESASSLQQKLGAPVRIDAAPQGFDSYIYNPGGDYSAYMAVGVKNNAVVSCFTISKGFSFGSRIKEGDSTSVLESGGWKADSRSDGYQISLDGGTAIAYYDMHGSGQVYGIQIFSNSYSTNQFVYAGSNDYTPALISNIEVQVRELTNAFRVYNGLAALKESAAGDAAARLHSQDMADHNYFDHYSQDGRSPFDRMKNAGISYSTAGENIIAGRGDAASMITGWIASSGHRSNILDSSYEYLGCGTGYNSGSTYGLYGTQNFWR